MAQAAEWFAVLASGSVSTAQQQQWQAWLQAHPDHRTAWARVEFFTHKFEQLPAQAASAALKQPDLQRRRTLKTLALLSALGLSGWQISKGRYLHNWIADYQTGLGETKTVRLADGSKVTLDTKSAFNFDYTQTLRRLQLVSGEIYIETAPDNSNLHRSLVVDSQEGRVRALGTRFSIRQLAGISQVTVFADAVEIQRSKAGLSNRTVKAGQTTRFTPDRIDKIVTISADRPAWTQGILLADNMPLSEFLLQLNRYRHGYISCDPQIADLRIVGSFPINDTNRILAMLAETLSIKITQPLPLWIKVLPEGN